MKIIYETTVSDFLIDQSQHVENEHDREKIIELASKLRHPSYVGLLASRDTNRQKQKTLTDDPEGGWESKKYSTLTPEEKAELHLAYDSHSLATKTLENPKNAHAEIVARIFPEPEEHHIDFKACNTSLKELGLYESGTKEWLEQRQNTVGGSDIGAILKLDPQWGDLNYIRVRESKLDPNPQSQEHVGATARGDMWEGVLLRAVEKALGERVFINKTTVTDGDRHANLDGFIPSENGGVDAIVECKTSSFPEEWGEDHIPPGYVMQVMHYASLFYAKRAYLVVNIDDQIIRVYEFDLQAIRTHYVPRPARQSFANPHIPLRGEIVAMPGVKEYKTTPGYLSIRRRSPQGGNYEFRSVVSYYDIIDFAVECVRAWREERNGQAPENKKAYRAHYKEWWKPWVTVAEKGCVWLDLETSHQSPAYGYIIEVGAKRDDGEVFDELYSPTDIHMQWNGTGAVDVHHITVDDVNGKPVLVQSPEEIQRLKDFIGGRVIIAHNAQFEKRWLDEILGEEQEYADTMYAFSDIERDNSNINGNSMAEFTKWAGVPYEDAHRALPDVLMMEKAAQKADFVGKALALQAMCDAELEAKEKAMKSYEEMAEILNVF